MGLSDEVVDLIHNGECGTAGALNGVYVNPFSAPLKEILEFLLAQAQMGKQYHTINSLRSAISMTHTDIDGMRVGQRPLVS